MSTSNRCGHLYEPRKSNLGGPRRRDTYKLHMELPFAGSRMLQGLLVHEGFKVGRLQHNPGGKPLKKNQSTVQTNRATSPGKARD